MYGLISLEILRSLDLDFVNDVDLIVGNSTGAIIASFLRNGHSLNRISNFYQEYAQDIFNRPLLHRIKTLNGLVGPKYSNKKLKELLGKYLFYPIHSPNKLMILSYNLTNNEPKFFKSWNDIDKYIFLNDICLCSSAAPTYFKPITMKKDTLNLNIENNTFIDGGMVANNPSMCAYAEAKRLWPDEEIKLLSIGNVSSDKQYSDKGWTLLKWAQNIPSFLLEGNSKAVDYQLKRLQESDDQFSYQRHHLSSSNIELMDCTDSEFLSRLIKMGEMYTRRHQEEIKEFFE